MFGMRRKNINKKRRNDDESKFMKKGEEKTKYGSQKK